MHSRFTAPSPHRLTGLLVATAATLLGSVWLAEPARAAISWDAEAATQWWFNPVNWNANSNANNLLPPTNPVSSGDVQINIGSGAWNASGEGVVYDPVNDPFFEDADTFPFPTGSPLTTTAGVMRDYGPETL